MAEPARPLRLLMVSHYFEERRGGVEIVAAALARELTGQGFEVTWLATGADAAGRASDGRARVLAASGIVERLLGIPYPVLMASGWRTLASEVERCDLVLVHDALYLTSIAAARAARAARKPCVVVQHVGLVPYRNAMLRALMAFANRRIAAPLLRGADQVVFISELTQRYFGNLGWRVPPALIFNGVDTQVFTPAQDLAAVARARESFGFGSGAPVALFVGRFVEKKGLAVLELLARARTDIIFAFAGSGPLDPAKWGLANVRIFSSLSGRSLAPLYQASALLLLPSVGEGFPLVVQEALACGLRVVCGSDTTRADARAAPFLDGVAVDLAQPAATAARLSAALTRLLAQPQPAADASERSDFARTSYSWGASGAAYAALLRRLRPP